MLEGDHEAEVSGDHEDLNSASRQYGGTDRELGHIVHPIKYPSLPNERPVCDGIMDVFSLQEVRRLDSSFFCLCFLFSYSSI